MIVESWDSFVKKLLPMRARADRLVAFISALLGRIEAAHTGTNTYIADARLRSAVTPQVCWLQKILSDTLGYTCTIAEGNGQPVDFTVSGVHYSDINRAYALLEQYKLAGRSYSVTISDITTSAAWSDYLCVRTNLVTADAEWSGYVCTQVLRVDTASWGSYVCATTLETLHIENQLGESIVKLYYNSLGTAINEEKPNGMQNIGCNPPYILHAPDTGFTIWQSAATIGNTTTNTNANCTVSLQNLNSSPYLRTLQINVNENDTNEARSWTFLITCGSSTLEFTITQSTSQI